MNMPKLWMARNTFTLTSLCTFSLVVSSIGFNYQCKPDDQTCNAPFATGLGKLIWGECSTSGILLRYDNLGLMECAKECLLTAQCTSINFRMKWKVCNLVSDFLSDNKTSREPDCVSSNISTWDRAVAGECANHNCQRGQKCKFYQSSNLLYCDGAYCVETPPDIPYSKIDEKFGLYRNYYRGIRHACTDSYSICGSPFVICSKTNKWEVSFSCIKDDIKVEHFRGSSYTFSETKKTWSDAKIDCEKNGMTLTSIESSMENQWLFEKVSRKYKFSKDTQESSRQFWLAGRRSKQEFIWVALSGTEVQFTYTNFNAGEPNNSGGVEDCLAIWQINGKWNDSPCDNNLYYICESKCKKH